MSTRKKVGSRVAAACSAVAMAVWWNWVAHVARVLRPAARRMEWKKSLFCARRRLSQVFAAGRRKQHASRVRYPAAAAVLVALTTAVAWMSLPKPPLLDGLNFSQQVFDRNQKLLRVTLTADEKYRIFTPLAQISPELVEATLMHEDRFFLSHFGVNPIAATRSAIGFCLRRQSRAGASTITMQLARMRFQIHSRTLRGKLTQMICALELERHYTKAQILEAYFNLAPYGGNIEGIGAASELYFGKPPSKLTRPEAVALSVIPQSPARRAPARGRDNEALTKAQDRLLKRLSEQRNGNSFRARADAPRRFIAPHFTTEVLAENAGHPERSAAESRDPVATRSAWNPAFKPFDGVPRLRSAPLHFARDDSHFRFEIVTTLDLDLQRILERRITSYVTANQRLGIDNAAAMLVDSRTMDVLAEVGSADFFDEKIDGQVDGTRSKRSPGSTLKPFVYALALDQGLIHPLSILKDAPRSFGHYNPENFDREFVGPIRAADALARSRNIPAIALASSLAHPTLFEFLKKTGVDLPRDEKFYGLTLPLGGAEVTMEDLIRLYAVLANGGRLRPLHRTLPHAAGKGARAISPEAAFLTLEMLAQISRPSTADGGSDAVFWKTGTSNGFRDAWSVSVFDHYVLAVWVGNFDGRSNPAFIGRTCAGPLLFQIIDALRANGSIGNARHDPPPGANLQRVEFCAISGRLPTAACRQRVTGWFMPGISPIDTCDVHRELIVDALTGLRVLQDDGTRAIKREVFEFWPADLLELFAKAGLPRRTPPPFLPGSEMENVSRRGKPPQIVSPKSGVVYNIRTDDETGRTVALKAEAEADATTIYWFADKAFLGAASAREAFHWRPESGSYAIVALDDQGRSNSRGVIVQRAESN